MPFQRSLENHAAAVSLYVMHYNFVRVHEALTPSAAHQNHASDGPWAHRSSVVDWSYWTRRLRFRQPTRRLPLTDAAINLGFFTHAVPVDTVQP
jgi:hypothetical protein